MYPDKELVTHLLIISDGPCREGAVNVALEELKRLNESIFVAKPLQLSRRADRT